MNDKIILSICIASYNQGEKLYEKVMQLLSYNNFDFQVVVSDNCSTDNTRMLLERIQDERFKFIPNDTNNGPVKNYLRALANGDGKYVMFVTDKDTVLPECLPNVITLLADSDFSVGYFVLDCIKQNNKIVTKFKTRLESFVNLAYLSKHPTGYLFNNALMQRIDIEKKFEDNSKVGYFPFEFICAELCMYGNAVTIEMPFCVTAKIIPNGGTLSATYSKQNNNLFFLPEQRFKVFENYVEHFITLGLSFNEKMNVLKRLAWLTYIYSTYEYKAIIENDDKCSHYKTDKVTVSDSQIKLLTTEFNSKLSKLKFLNKQEIEILTKYCRKKQAYLNIRKKIRCLILYTKKKISLI